MSDAVLITAIICVTVIVIMLISNKKDKNDKKIISKGRFKNGSK